MWWNLIIPSKLFVLVWQLFHNRLPSKENLSKREVYLRTSVLCVGGYSKIETVNHIFFSCPILSVI